MGASSRCWLRRLRSRLPSYSSTRPFADRPRAISGPSSARQRACCSSGQPTQAGTARGRGSEPRPAICVTRYLAFCCFRHGFRMFVAMCETARSSFSARARISGQWLAKMMFGPSAFPGSFSTRLDEPGGFLRGSKRSRGLPGQRASRRWTGGPTIRSGTRTSHYEFREAPSSIATGQSVARSISPPHSPSPSASPPHPTGIWSCTWSGLDDNRIFRSRRPALSGRGRRPAAGIAADAPGRSPPRGCGRRSWRGRARCRRASSRRRPARPSAPAWRCRSRS
ncbi:hypothetical protein ACVIJ6_005459 [Bradyrhizobium sp. USDA 4369]